MKDNVLICMPNGIVADDVVATVSEVHPNPEFRVVRDVDALCATLDRHQGWAWAVLDVPGKDLVRADLRQALSRNHVLPVVFAPRSDDPDLAGWVFLDPPFNSEMLRKALDRTRPCCV